MKQKNKPCSFTPPLHISQIKKTGIFLATLLENPNEQKTQLLKSEERIYYFLLRTDCIRAAEPDHTKLCACTGTVKKLRNGAAACAHIAILKENQPVTRRCFLKAIVPNLLSQNLWHVRRACQSILQTKLLPLSVHGNSMLDVD